MDGAGLTFMTSFPLPLDRNYTENKIFLKNKKKKVVCRGRKSKNNRLFKNGMLTYPLSIWIGFAHLKVEFSSRNLNERNLRWLLWQCSVFPVVHLHYKLRTSSFLIKFILKNLVQFTFKTFFGWIISYFFSCKVIQSVVKMCLYISYHWPCTEKLFYHLLKILS